MRTRPLPLPPRRGYHLANQASTTIETAGSEHSALGELAGLAEHVAKVNGDVTGEHIVIYAEYASSVSVDVSSRPNAPRFL